MLRWKSITLITILINKGIKISVWLKNPEKKTKDTQSKRKKVKIKFRINKTLKRQIEKNYFKGCFFENINKINNALSKSNKEQKRENDQYQEYKRNHQYRPYRN